jgi:hypothetical protein
MDDPPNVAKLVDAALARDKAKAARKEAAADCSEDQLAIAFVDRHERQLRYVALWGKWVKWAGAYWEQETTLAAFDLARSLCREAAPAKAKTVAAVEMLSRSEIGESRQPFVNGTRTRRCSIHPQTRSSLPEWRNRNECCCD